MRYFGYAHLGHAPDSLSAQAVDLTQNHEWESLVEYLGSLSSERRYFIASVWQMQSEDPLTQNPIIDCSCELEAGAVAGTRASVARRFHD